MASLAARAVGAALLLAPLFGCAAPDRQSQGPPGGQWSVGYWTPWGMSPPTSSLDWGALSHVVYGFAVVRSDGSLDLQSLSLADNAARVVSAARAAGVKPMVSLAQAWWGGDRSSFEQAATRNRRALVDEVVAVVEGYGFEGVDIDWEPFDAESQGPALLALAAELRARLGPARLLTVAVSYHQSDYAYWGTAHAHFDRVSLMTYDMSGSWDPYTWHNSALYDPDGRVWSVALAVERFIAAGVPPDRVNIGIPFYGYVWSGATGPRQPVAGTTMRQSYYRDLAARYDLKDARWDDLAQVPYLAGDPFVSFDDERSVAAKVDYAVKRGLGGWIIWELGGDALPDSPLLAAVKRAWRGPVAAGARRPGHS